MAHKAPANSSNNSLAFKVEIIVNQTKISIRCSLRCRWCRAGVPKIWSTMPHRIRWTWWWWTSFKEWMLTNNHTFNLELRWTNNILFKIRDRPKFQIKIVGTPWTTTIKISKARTRLTSSSRVVARASFLIRSPAISLGWVIKSIRISNRWTQIITISHNVFFLNR